MTEADEIASLRDRIGRLERRASRERAARVEAEQIAEEGLRKLWQANRLLEQRVQERTVDLERSLDAAKMAAAAKERFLAELGHELTTPLHNVLGLLELIEPSRLGPEDRDRVEEIRTHASSLSELLRGLIELAGAEGAPSPQEQVDLDPAVWLDDVVATWTRAAAQRAQLLVPSSHAGTGAVTLDWRRLRRAVDAVLSNATTHANAGSISVDLRVEPERVTVVVTDSGPGMTPELVTSAREPFVAAGDHAGIGVGLAVADRLARAAGGELRLDADDGRTSATVSIHRVGPSASSPT